MTRAVPLRVWMLSLQTIIAFPAATATWSPSTSSLTGARLIGTDQPLPRRRVATLMPFRRHREDPRSTGSGISDERREQAVQMILEPPYSGWLRTGVTPLTETIKLSGSREALLRSALLRLRLASRFWIDAARLHPAARAAAGERYGSLAE